MFLIFTETGVKTVQLFGIFKFFPKKIRQRPA